MRDGRDDIDRRTAILIGGGLLGSLLAACTGAPETTVSNTAVDLVYKGGRIIGSLATKSVDVTAELPISAGTLEGTVGKLPVSASWNVTHSGSDQTLIPAALHGSLGGQAVSLNGMFQLAPRFLFEAGTITGTAGGSPVRAQARRATGQSSSSVNVDGTFSGTAFSLYATLAGDLSSGIVRGTVGNKPAQLTARSHSGWITITGSYDGPLALLALVTGCLLYFL